MTTDTILDDGFAHWSRSALRLTSCLAVVLFACSLPIAAHADPEPYEPDPYEPAPSAPSSDQHEHSHGHNDSQEHEHSHGHDDSHEYGHSHEDDDSQEHEHSHQDTSSEIPVYSSSSSTDDSEATTPEYSSSSTDSAVDSSEDSRYHTTTYGRDNDEPAERWSLDAQDPSSQSRSTADQLRRVPGVVVQRHATEGKGEQFLVRGFDAGHGTDVEVTLNGVPLNGASHVHGHGYIDLSWIPTAALYTLDWTPGSFSLEQGAFATAGSINLEVGGHHTSQVGYRTSSTLRQHIWGRYVDDENPHDRWIATEFVYDRGYGEDRHVMRGNFLASTSLIHTRKVELNAQLGASANRFDVPSFVKRDDIDADRIGYYDGYDTPNDGEAQTAWMALPFTIRTENKWRIDGFGSLDFRRFYLFSSTTGFLLNPALGDTQQIEDRRIALRTRVQARKNISRAVQIRTFSEATSTFVTQTEDNVEESGALIDETRDLDAALTTVTAGTGVRWFPHTEWTIDASLRLDYLRFDVKDRVADGIFHDDGWILSPRGSVEWEPTDAFELRAAYGRGFRPWEAQAVVPAVESEVPTDDLDRPQPDPTITDHVELAAGWHTEHINLRAAAFAIFSPDEYYYDHVARESRSLGSTRRLGGEFAVSAKPFEWWEIEATALAVDARLLERDGDSRVPAVPIINGLLSFDFHLLTNITLSGDLRFVGRRELLYASEAAGYAIVDAEVAWKRNGLRIWLGVENVGNSEYSEAEYSFSSAFFPDVERSQIPRLHIAAGPPRIVHGGITYEF